MLWRYFLLGFVTLVTAGALWSLVDLQVFFETGSEMIRGGGVWYEILSALIFILLSALSALLSFVSSVVLIPVAVGIFGNWLAIVLLMIGWILGGVVTYWIGWHASHPVLKHFSVFRKLDKWRSQIPISADWLLAFLFRFGTPSETGYLFGVIRYPWKKYLIVTFFAELPYAILAVYAGDAFAEREVWQFVSLIFFMFVFSASAGYILRKRIKYFFKKKR